MIITLPQAGQHWPGGMMVIAPSAQMGRAHTIEINYSW